MQKKSVSQSGIFNPRTLLALLFCSVGISLTLLSLDARPLSWARFQKGKGIPKGAAAEVAPQAPTTAGMPRYYNYAPDAGIGENAGDPSIGFNPVSQRFMFLAGLQTLQVILPENLMPPGSVPQACNATW